MSFEAVCVCVCVCGWVVCVRACVCVGGEGLLKFTLKLGTAHPKAQVIILATYFTRQSKCATARLLRLWVRIRAGAWMSICCECCVLSGRSLCDELITHPEESYWLCCVVVCDLENSWMRRPRPTGAVAPKTNRTKFTYWVISHSVSKFTKLRC